MFRTPKIGMTFQNVQTRFDTRKNFSNTKIVPTDVRTKTISTDVEVRPVNKSLNGGMLSRLGVQRGGGCGCGK
jgi:hypothetical protein